MGRGEGKIRSSSRKIRCKRKRKTRTNELWQVIEQNGVLSKHNTHTSLETTNKSMLFLPLKNSFGVKHLG